MATNMQYAEWQKEDEIAINVLRDTFPFDQLEALENKVRAKLSDQNMFASDELIEVRLVAYWLGLSRRSITLFDDSRRLMRSGDLVSAPILARSFLENLGATVLFSKKLRHAIKQGDMDDLNKVYCLFTQADRFMLELDQDPEVEKLYLTPEARSRRNQRQIAPPKPPHVNDGLDEAKKRVARKFNKTAKTIFSDQYSVLCEATHPSRTSVLHAQLDVYTDTSVGKISYAQQIKFNVGKSLTFLWLAFEDWEEVLSSLISRIGEI